MAGVIQGNRIVRFTSSEGSNWINIVPLKLNRTFGNGAHITKHLDTLQNTLFIFYGGTVMHSFETNVGAQWDCVNGWRNPR